MYGSRAFAETDELLAQELDVVVVATPHPSHAELTIAALEAGAHVLCEKPLAPEVREADAMIAAADRAGRLLGVCFQQRFRPVIAAARRLVDEGRLGALVRASIVDPLYRPNAYYRTADWRGTWKGEGGGVLMNQAPHTLDLLCHLAGPPATVWGVAQRRAQPMEAEDTATALLVVRRRRRRHRWPSRRSSRACSASSSSATAGGSRSSASRSRSSASSRRSRSI